MTLTEKQSVWRERFGFLPGPQERLAEIAGRRSRLEPLADEERTEENLVPGCLSRVWLTGDVVDGVLRLRVDAEAGIVRALAAWLAELYDGAEAGDAGTFSPTLLEDLGLSAMLSPTRLNGLGKVCERIRALAAGR